MSLELEQTIDSAFNTLDAAEKLLQRHKGALTLNGSKLTPSEVIALVSGARIQRSLSEIVMLLESRT